jgi:hypothetical protein
MKHGYHNCRICFVDDIPKVFDIVRLNVWSLDKDLLHRESIEFL